ncbi:MAG: DUF2231 domain-containing protein [Aeromicrobium sp.]
MPNDYNGLPLHPLVVHATVVIIPLAALTVVLFAAWPRFRSWAGPLPLALSLIGVVLVPLSTATGETLERHTAASALLERHTQLADGLLPWMISLAVISALGYALHRRSTNDEHIRRLVAVAVAVLAVGAAAGTTVQVARVGDAGAKAAWASTNMNPSSPKPPR